MEQFFYPMVTAFVTALITWLFSRKSRLLDNEIKAATLYKNLLDDATKRLNEAVETINAQDSLIKELMREVELLTEELKKFKQLNGKTTHDTASR